MLLYVAGPYRGNVEVNIASARKVAIALWESGHVVICPHLNTANFEQDCGCKDEDYLTGDLEILQRCDGAVFIPGWKQSEGARAEWRFCEAEGIPVYYWDLEENGGVMHAIPPHPVEVNCPAQVSGFISTVMRMYRLHLSKNMDYSPANILGTGEVGSVVRLWDKMARLMNLMGFRIKIAGSSYEAPKTPKHESVDDTLLDLANYAVIAFLLRKGWWGK